MSSQITKLGLLSLISAAAAVPHGHAARHFHPSGKPSGAPWGGNATGIWAPTGTGRGGYDTTSQVTETLYSTQTIVSTVYVKPVPVSSAGAASFSAVAAQVSGAASGQCGAQETVYVTATNKVTVTVIPGASSAAASSVAAASSSANLGSFVLPSSSAAAQAVSSSVSLVNHGYGSSSVAAAAASSYAAPVSSAAQSSYAASSAAASSVAASSAAASSALPSSSSTPSSPGGKRGVPYNDASLLDAFTGGKVSWAYSWGQDATGVPSGLTFIPMLWGPKDEFTNSWEANWKKFLASGTKTFFSFNEADLSSQANLSPDAAATAHKQWLNPIKEADGSVTIASPSVTNGANGMGLDWLSSFQTACGGSCAWDVTNIHWYEAPTQTQYFKDHVTEAHTKFGKPVYVSEFGLNSDDDSAINAFLEEILPWLDSQDFVVGYAMYMVKDAPGLLSSGTGQSAVGKVYAST